MRAGLAAVAVVAGWASHAAAQQPSSEEIQRQREEAERKRHEYMDEKSRVEHINERVNLYKQLQASIPFEPVPNTSNMVQVFMNGQDLRETAEKIYSVADAATPAGFSASYWPTVLYLNRAKDYDGGLPRYGKLDPQSPELNVALFPNIRKQGYTAIVASIENADSSMALEMTAPVVLAYRKRLEAEVVLLAQRGGDVRMPRAPASLPGENHAELFRGAAQETKTEYPPRKSAYPALYVSTDPVPVDMEASLEPAPRAYALQHGFNMLGPEYEGYNLEYNPGKVDLQPEVGVIAFMGGRNANGDAVTQPGVELGFNQRLFGFLLLNESAFVAFAASEAPVINGGSLSGGLDINFRVFNLAGMIGYTAVRLDGHTEDGPSYAVRLRAPIGPRVYLSGDYRFSNIEYFRVVDETGGHTGVTNASYFGLGFVFR